MERVTATALRTGAPGNPRLKGLGLPQIGPMMDIDYEAMRAAGWVAIGRLEPPACGILFFAPRKDDDDAE